MSRLSMLLRMVNRALWVRPGKLVLSVTALTVGAMLTSAFLSIYFELPEKMSSQFRTLGPNLLVAPQGAESTLDAAITEQIAAREPRVALLPWLYAVGQAGGRDVILAGTELAGLARMHPTWHGLPLGSSDGLIAGQRAATAFGWTPGTTVEISYGGRRLSVPLIGVVATGGSEDSQLLLPLPALQSLTGQAGRLSLIELAAPGQAAEVQAVWQRLAAQAAAPNGLAGVEIRPLRPVLESEARVVMKVRGLMLGLSGIVLALVILSVLTTVSGRILDRQKDIGVMKALGGSDASIAAFFLAETAVQAVIAGLAGFAAGYWLAEAAAERIFRSAVAPRGDVALAVVGITVAVALIATLLPARWIRRLDTAVVLRGE